MGIGVERHLEGHRLPNHDCLEPQQLGGHVHIQKVAHALLGDLLPER